MKSFLFIDVVVGFLFWMLTSIVSMNLMNLYLTLSMRSVDAFVTLDLHWCAVSMRLLYLTSSDVFCRCACCVWLPLLCFVDALVVFNLCQCCPLIFNVNLSHVNDEQSATWCAQWFFNDGLMTKLMPRTQGCPRRFEHCLQWRAEKLRSMSMRWSQLMSIPIFEIHVEKDTYAKKVFDVIPFRCHVGVPINLDRMLKLKSMAISLMLLLISMMIPTMLLSRRGSDFCLPNHRWNPSQNNSSCMHSSLYYKYLGRRTPPPFELTIQGRLLPKLAGNCFRGGFWHAWVVWPPWL